jgi:hypothetical protein
MNTTEWLLFGILIGVAFCLAMLKGIKDRLDSILETMIDLFPKSEEDED